MNNLNLEFNQQTTRVVDVNSYELKLICRNLFYNIYMKEEVVKYTQIFKSVLTKENIWGILHFFIEKFIQEGTKMAESSSVKFKYCFKNIFRNLIQFYQNKVSYSYKLTNKQYSTIGN